MSADPFDLQRFVAAQDPVWPAVTAELAAGCKRSHWMWFVFPQLRGLGHSPTARFYGVGSLAEARAFLAHPVLGDRLDHAARLLLGLHGLSAHAVFGSPDDMKLRSSMTLFARAASNPGSACQAVLARYFDGIPDNATLALLDAPA